MPALARLAPARLGVRGQQQRARGQAARREALLQEREVLRRPRAQQVAELAQQVARDLDHALVRAAVAQLGQHLLRGVRLQVRRIGHDLDDAVPGGGRSAPAAGRERRARSRGAARAASAPDVVAHEVARLVQEGDDDVHVPALRGCVLLCQDGNLEHQLLANRKVRHDQVIEQLAHHVLRVGGVAHAVQQVQRAPPDADVRVVQRLGDLLLVALHRGRHLRQHGQAPHVLQAQIPTHGRRRAR